MDAAADMARTSTRTRITCSKTAPVQIVLKVSSCYNGVSANGTNASTSKHHCAAVASSRRTPRTTGSHYEYEYPYRQE
eukprot:scaffold184816_cov37-Prasinocladus_malaysianus.AAC.1